MRVVIIKSDKKAREKPCLRCGYSLRKSLDAMHCPECGLSVWRSLNSNDALDWSHPDWLRTISWGAMVWGAAQLAALPVYGAAVYAEFLEPRWMAVVPLPTGMYAVASALGLFVLANDEGRYPDRWKTFKWCCRGAAAVIALIGAWFIAAGAHALGATAQHLAASHAVGALNVVILGGVLAGFAYLRKLAPRVPRSGLAKLCGWLLLGPLLSLLKSVPIFSFYFAFAIADFAFTFLPVLYLPVTAGLLFWFALIFRKSAVAADQGWAAETASTEPAAVG